MEKGGGGGDNMSRGVKSKLGEKRGLVCEAKWSK